MPRFPKGTSRIAIGLALAALLGACNAPNDDSAATGPATDAADDSAAATATAGTGAAAGEALPLTGQAFVDAASASDQFELESARIVQSKGITGDLRDFAQMMIRDRTASSNALQAAASKVQGVQLRQAPFSPQRSRASSTSSRLPPAIQLPLFTSGSNWKRTRRPMPC